MNKPSDDSRRGSGQPQRAGDLLKGLLKEVGTKAARSDLSVALESAVGPERAPHVEVLGFRGGRLTVGVDSAPLHVELAGFHRESLREKINEQLTNRKVARLDFRLVAHAGSSSHP